MPKIIKIKKNYLDKRGYIQDIFVKSPKDHCSIVTFNKNALRGNHYHKKTTQYTFILSGILIFYYCKISKKTGLIISKIKKKLIKKNTLIIHPPYEFHSFLAKKKTVALAFACGKRGGEFYEHDTVRVKLK